MRCKETKSITEFYKHVRQKDGYDAYCKVCSRKMVAANRVKNLEKECARVKRWQAKNKDKKKAWDTQYWINNPGRNAYHCAKRRMSKLNRTPKWLTDEDMWVINEIYHVAKIRQELTGFNWHVDHIIPLQGKRVSGLHVPNNLQVIPGIENIRKRNTYGI